MISVAQQGFCRKCKRSFWVPPQGRPFWTDRHPAEDMTDAELLEHFSRESLATRGLLTIDSRPAVGNDVV